MIARLLLALFCTITSLAHAQSTSRPFPPGAPGQRPPGIGGRGHGAAAYWLPEGVTTVRAVVLGRHFLPPNAEWQAFGKKYSVAIASGVESLPAMAGETKHPEIETAPIVTTGISAGGLLATQTALRFSNRVLAVIPIHGAMLAKGNDGFNVNRMADTPGEIATLDVEKLLKVPMALTYDDGDGFVSPVTMEGFLQYGRAKGAPWMFLVSKGGNHTDSKEDFSKVLLPWLGAIIETRLPVRAATVPLADYAESSGWLGDLRTKDIAAFASFKGNKAKACWFPNESAALAWKSHLMIPTYTIPEQPLKEPSGLIAGFEVYDKSNTDTKSGQGWRINANFKEADQLCNNLKYFVTGPVPKLVEGCDWIRTMNGGKFTQALSADPPFGFTVTADCTVYVAHDDQQQGKVVWLADWTDTQETINVCGGLLEKRMEMRLYSKKFRKGEKVTPGANSTAPRPHGVMYVTLVKPDDAKAVATPAPTPVTGANAQSDGQTESVQTPKKTQPAVLSNGARKPVKVLAIGRSEFGSGGTLGKAIQAWGQVDGVTYAEVDQGKEFGYGDFISYKPILERKLAAEKFDYVLLSMHNECWSLRKPEDLIAAAADCQEIITKHGAQTILYMLFKGPKSPPVETVVPLYEKAFQAMKDRSINGKKYEVLYIPGLLLSEAARAKEQTERGGGQRATGWEQGGIHPTELGQYAYGCLIYTFISGKDPHQIAFKTGLEDKDAKWIWDNVWTIYNKLLTNKNKSGKAP